MSKDEPISLQLDDLRRQADKILQLNPEQLQGFSAEEIHHLIQELGMYLVRLEMHTERFHRAQEKSDQLLERYINLFDFAPTGYFIFDKNGLILDANHTGASQLGQEKDHLIGQPFVLFVVQEHRDMFLIHLRQVFRSQSQDRHILELKLTRGNGAEFYARIESIRANDRQGNGYHCRTMVDDISKHKKMEEELQRTQKIKSAGVLAGSIAHEFREVLMVIIGALSLAKMYPEDGNKVLDFVDQAEAAAIRAKNLTQHLLAFFRSETLIRRTVRLPEFLNNAADTDADGCDARGCDIRDRAGGYDARGCDIRDYQDRSCDAKGNDAKGYNSAKSCDAKGYGAKNCTIKTEYSLPADLWPVAIDERQIRQVIDVLITAAEQAMPEGGTIKITAENFVVGAEESLPLKDGNYVKVSIKDQGWGLRKEDLYRIFDPCFSPTAKGSGLELAASYLTIRKHGGHISVESQFGSGTTFALYLPAVLQQRESYVRKSGKQKSCPARRRILLMEDEKIVRHTAGQMLEYFGYEVEFALDGVEAINLYKKAKKSGHPFDAVIMDLKIPGGMGGVEAIQELRRLDPEVKAVVSSGYADDLVMSQFKRYGFSAAIAKPYRIQELTDILQFIIGK
ncbi:MAG: response regulator [bacterium]